MNPQVDQHRSYRVQNDQSWVQDEQQEGDSRSSKITDLEIPFFFLRKPGQASIMIRIEGDGREQCEKILRSLEIVGDTSKYDLLRLDRYPKEYTVLIVVNPDSE